MSNGEGGNGNVVIVKNWRVILTLITWLVVCTMAFTSLRVQSDDHERRLRILEERPSVTRQQWETGQRSIEQRLDRIERKLDETDARKR